MIQLPRVSSIEVTTPPPFALMHSFQSWDEIFFKGRAVTLRVMETLILVINK
jgi:hypothetical protein